jgi:hypothetical protein
MLVYLIVIWAVTGGLWLWILIWDVKLHRINGQLRSQLSQLQRTLSQRQAEPLCTGHIGQKPSPSLVERASKLEK